MKPIFSRLKIIRPQIYNQNWILGNLNIAFIEIIRNYLNINCDIYLSSELAKSKGNQKLVDICKLLGAKFIVKPPKAIIPKNFLR